MDKRQIIFLIVIVLIGVIFAAGTVAGAINQPKGGEAGPQLNPTQLAKQLGGIQDTLANPPVIKPVEIRAVTARSSSTDCIRLQSQLIAPAGATCVFSIAPAEKTFFFFSPAVRKLKLSLTEGDQAAISLEQKVKQEGGSSVTTTTEKDLKRQETGQPVDVYQEGGTLAVACLPLPGISLCRVEVLK